MVWLSQSIWLKIVFAKAFGSAKAFGEAALSQMLWLGRILWINLIGRFYRCSKQKITAITNEPPISLNDFTTNSLSISKHFQLLTRIRGPLRSVGRRCRCGSSAVGSWTPSGRTKCWGSNVTKSSSPRPVYLNPDNLKDPMIVSDIAAASQLVRIRRQSILSCSPQPPGSFLRNWPTNCRAPQPRNSSLFVILFWNNPRGVPNS